MPQLTGADRARQIAMEVERHRRLHQRHRRLWRLLHPQAYGSSIAMTGSPVGALWLFLAFYVICLVLTWVVYTRPGGLLHEIERGRAFAAPHPAE